MFRTLTIALCLLFSYNIIAQYDNTAPTHLDHLAKAIKDSEGIKVDFSIKMEEIGKDNVLDSDRGTLLLKGESYALDFNGTTSYSDGKDQWIFLKEEKEVTVQELDKTEITAANIFTQYQEGFRFRTLKDDGETAVIELIPTDKSSPYIRITMNISIPKNQLIALVIQSRNAMLTEINVNAWENTPLTTDHFRFKREQHPDVDVIDLR